MRVAQVAGSSDVAEPVEWRAAFPSVDDLTCAGFDGLAAVDADLG